LRALVRKLGQALTSWSVEIGALLNIRRASRRRPVIL